MPHSCAAINCGNSSSRNGDISFFGFPCDIKRCKKWVINTRRADLDDKTPEQLHKNYVLCSSHFENSQFTNVLQNRLNWNAIPTLFNVPNPPPKLSCTRQLPLRRKKEITSTFHAIQGVTSNNLHSSDLSSETECMNTCDIASETDSHAENSAAAPVLKVDQQPSVTVEISPHDTSVKTPKTECETSPATCETGSRIVEVSAPLLNLNQQPLLPVAIAAPQAPVIRILKLIPKIWPQSPLNKLNCKKVIFKTSFVNAQPVRLIRPVQATLADPAAYKALSSITAQGTQPKNASLRLACGSFKQTVYPSAAITSSQSGSSGGKTTEAISNIAQRVSVSHVKKTQEISAEKKLKQKIRKLYSQLWRKNRKIEALKKKVAETPPESTKPQRSIEAILGASKGFLTPVQLSLLRAQLLNSQKEKNGYRWSTSDKIFGLQLLYKSPAAFRFVSEHLALPTQGTLRRFVAETLGSKNSEATPETCIPPAALETDDNQME